MGFFGSMDTAASGLTAERLRLDIISQNLANADTTRTAAGGPYKRKTVLFEERTNGNTFSNILNSQMNGQNGGVRVKRIVEDQSQGPLVYNPNHPDANAQGYVEMPNVNTIDEMVNMISASRAFEANITSFNNMKAMFNKALEIGSK